MFKKNPHMVEVHIVFSTTDPDIQNSQTWDLPDSTPTPWNQSALLYDRRCS